MQVFILFSKVLKGRYRLHFIAFHDDKNHVSFDTLPLALILKHQEI